MIRPPELTAEVRKWLPNLFIIGAPKSGTTSLHAYLAEHPQAAMTTIKEPLCFSRRNWEARLPEYVELFGGRAGKVRGESSTGYSAYPWIPEIPARIRATVPDARIIYLVRDPIERALSHHAQQRWDGLKVEPWDDLMGNLEDPMNMPVWCSRYATQIERYIERFGADRVLVLEQRDLLERRLDTIERVLHFVGLDTGFRSPAWADEHNVSSTHRRPTRAAHVLPSLRRGPLARFATREIAPPRITAQQRRRLEALFAPEVARLREITGLQLADWCV